VVIDKRPAETLRVKELMEKAMANPRRTSFILHNNKHRRSGWVGKGKLDEPNYKPI
jgi:hypothetical protein